MNDKTSNRDEVHDRLVTPDGLNNDAAPPDNNTPADPPIDPVDQSIEAALPEAPGTPDANPESSDSHPGTPEAPAPPTTEPPKTKQPRAKRPDKPGRENKLLKTNRDGIGGPSTPEGKAISSLNNTKHGMYSRLPFYLLANESQEEYDTLHNRLRALFPPVDESSAQMLEMHLQAFYRVGRCNHAEFLAESSDRTDLDKFLRRVGTVSMHRSRCERSYYTHLEKLKQALADDKQQQDEIREQAQAEETEKLEEEAKPKPRYNAEGEEMHPDWPKKSIHKFSCLPESHLNEVLEFDRTLSNKYTVKRTPLRDYQGGWMLHPDVKPLGMKGEWPEYALGRYKNYYASRKKEDIKNLVEDIKNL